MPQDADFLQARADEIVAAASELAEVEGFEAPLRQVIELLKGCVEGSCTVNIGPLQQAGADDATVANLLRALQAVCIEAARRECPSAAFPDFVLALRRCIRRTLPPPQADRERLRRFQVFMETSAAMDGGDSPVLPMFQCIMSTLRDLVFVHDLTGTLLYLNRFGLDMLRCTPVDLVEGLNIFDFIVPEYRDVVLAQLETPGGLLRAPYTIELCAMDGERIPVEVDWRAMSPENPEDTPIVGVARDLRLGRRLHEEIRRAHAYLDNLTENAPIGILLTDACLIIRDANAMAAALCGAPDANALIGVPAYELGGREDPLAEEAYRRVLNGDGSLRERLKLRSCFGATLACDVHVSAVRDHEEVQGLLILLVDVSEETALREHLVQSEKLSVFGDAAAGLAHALDAPLANVLGSAESIAAEGSKKVCAHAQRIIEDMATCREVVSTLSAFAGQCKKDRARQNINQLLQDTLSFCEYQLTAEKISVTLDLQRDLPLVDVRVRELMRVFLNLVNNARSALGSVNDRNRVLAVSTRLSNGRVVICFRDTGCGIPKSLVTRVFDPFYTMREMGHGAGLGLRLACGIIEGHGGTIRIDSEESKGTTVTIELPVA